MSKPRPTPLETPLTAEALVVPAESAAVEVQAETLSEPVIMRLLQEQLTAGKTWAQAGTVVFRKTVETTAQEVPVALAYEEVTVERVPVERVLAEGEAAPVRQQDDLLIIPVVVEELIVLKRRVVREEIRVRKVRQTRQEVIRDTVRHERLTVETSGDIELVGGDGS